MLKIIKLRNQLKQKQNALTVLRELKTKFELRKAELEAASNDAQTDEDIEEINAQIAELETELNGRDLEQEEQTLVDEIADIDAQIADMAAANSAALGNPQPADATPAAVDPNTNTERNNQEVFTTMNTRTIFGRISSERRAALLATEESKNFLERVRSFKGQQRAVSGGELFIPDNYLGLIREYITEYSRLAKHVFLKPLKGKARQGVQGIIPEAVWVEAVGKLNELDISFGMIEVDGYKVGAYAVIPNSTLEDSDENLAADILEAFAIAIGKALDKAIVYGTGNKMPLGFVTRLAQTVKPSDWSEKAPAWTNLRTSNILTLDLASKDGADFFRGLSAAFGVPANKYAANNEMFWVMNRKTHIDIKAKALAFNSAAALVSATNGEMPFIGGTIVELEDMADFDIGGGFGALYTLVERAGTSLGSSDQVLFIEDQTAFKGTARYDGKPSIGEGFVLFNYANIAPKTTATFAVDKANEATAD